MTRSAIALVVILVVLSVAGCLEKPTARIDPALLLRPTAEAAMKNAIAVRDRKYGLVATQELVANYCQKCWPWDEIHYSTWAVPVDLDLAKASSSDFVGIPFSGCLPKKEYLIWLKLEQHHTTYTCKVVDINTGGASSIVVVTQVQPKEQRRSESPKREIVPPQPPIKTISVFLNRDVEKPEAHPLVVPADLDFDKLARTHQPADIRFTATKPFPVYHGQRITVKDEDRYYLATNKVLKPGELYTLHLTNIVPVDETKPPPI